VRSRASPGGSLERVVFVNYGNLAMHQGDRICPASRRGFDAHPTFGINGDKLGLAARFVETSFCQSSRATPPAAMAAAARTRARPHDLCGRDTATHFWSTAFAQPMRKIRPSTATASATATASTTQRRAA
jgi:hypothetical protein